MIKVMTGHDTLLADSVLAQLPPHDPEQHILKSDSAIGSP
jgi:hypothetical protein